MKKLLIIMLIMVLVASLLISCANQAKPSPSPEENGKVSKEETPAKTKKLKVAGVVFQEDQFMRLVQLGYEAAAKDAGVEVALNNTNGDTTKELELINTYVAQGYDGLAICPINEDTSIEALRKADQEGMRIAISNLSLADIDFICGGYTSNQYDLCVPSGEMAKEFILANYPEGSTIKVARLGAMSVLPDITRDRWNGFQDQIKDIPGYTVEVVADQDAWLQDDAVAAVDGMLAANPDLNIIYGFNEGSAIGATMAVKNSGNAGKVFVFGIDANEQLINMIKDPDNILQGTTSQDPFMMGYLTMEVLIKGLKGEDISATKGKVFTTDYIPLKRGETEKLDAFLADMKAKMGN
ncbi:MAG: substrate-binding domain-containing protein [Acetivibrionales bacterium]|jgi:ABC-type sugar transport system substrate-binding protein